MQVRQGEEPQELLTALASTPLTSRLGSSDGTLSARQAAVRASPRPCKAVECDAWTQDYQVGCGWLPAIAWGCLPLEKRVGCSKAASAVLAPLPPVCMQANGVNAGCHDQ